MNHTLYDNDELKPENISDEILHGIITYHTKVRKVININSEDTYKYITTVYRGGALLGEFEFENDIPLINNKIIQQFIIQEKYK